MKSELILKGTINILILTELSHSPLYGYALEKKINDKLNYNLPPGTIYTLLHSLQKKNYIECINSETEQGRKLKTYALTSSGKEFLKMHRDPLKSVRRIIDYLIDEINRL